MKQLNFIFSFLLGLVLITSSAYAQESQNILGIGDYYFKQANFKRALDSYNLYIENNRDDPRGYLHRARVHAAMGNTNAYQLDFQMAERLNPLSHMYLDASLRSNYYANKFYDYNVDDTEGSFSKSPLRLADYVEYIDTLMINHEADSLISDAIKDIAEKNFVDAEFTLDKVKVNQSNLPLVYDLKGLIKLKTGDIESAITHFTTVIDYAPSFAIAYHNRAICYKLLEQYDMAKSDLKKAISINDDLPMFFFAFAKLNQKEDNIEVAKEYYKKAIDIDSDYKEASANYSQLLKNIGDYDSSLLYLSDLTALEIESSEQHYLKANLHFVYGEFEDAKHHLSEFLSTNPEDKDALYNLGLTYLLLREYDEGCAYILESLEDNNNEMRKEIYDSYCYKYF
jgi:tetratricopeptide (TPR) repeat protein